MTQAPPPDDLPLSAPAVAPTPGARVLRGLRRVAIGLSGGLAGLALVSWAAVPLVLPWAVSGPVSQALGRAATLESASFNPLTLRLNLAGLKVAGATPEAPALFELGQLTLDVAWSSLWHAAPVVEEVRLVQPRVRLARTGEGHYDVDDLIARFAQAPKEPEPPKPPEGKPPARFALHNLTLEDGEIGFDDRPKQRQHQISGLSLGLPFIANLSAADVATTVTPRLAFNFDGTAFKAEAESTPFAPDHASRLRLGLGRFDLAAWQPYVPAFVPLVLRQGGLEAELALRFAAPPQAQPEVAVSGEVALRELLLADRQGHDLAALGLLQLKMGDVQPLRQQLGLDAVRLDDLRLDTRRSADGSLNWLRLLEDMARGAAQAARAAPAQASAPRVAAAPVARPASSAAPGWQVQLGELALSHVALGWQDAAVRPAAALTLDLAELQGRHLAWPLRAQAPESTLSARLRVLPVALPLQGALPQQAAGQLTLAASASHTGGQAHLTVQDVLLAPAAPYLASFLHPRVTARLGLDATARWQGQPGAQPPQVEVAALRVHDLAVLEPNATQPALAWGLLEVAGVALDLAQHRVQVSSVALTRLQAQARRDAQGQLNLQAWLKPQPAAGGAAPAASVPAGAGGHAAAAPSPAWQVRLGEVRVDAARLAWRDAAAPGGPVALDVPALSLKVRSVAWPAQAGRPIGVQARLSVAPPEIDLRNAGQIRVEGQLGLAPVDWAGQVDIQRFPAQALVAYGGALVPPVDIARAELGWRGQTAVTLAPKGLEAQAQGDLNVVNLLVRTRPSQGHHPEELLTWQALDVKGLHVGLRPGAQPQVDIQEVALADFYARLLIDEKGQLNFNALRPAEPASAPAPGAEAASAPGGATPPDDDDEPDAAATAASAASAPAQERRMRELPLALQVEGIKLSNGRVDFTDRFIRPNYSAALTDLTGSFGRFGTRISDEALLRLTGRVAGTGALNIQGSLNPLALPLALNITAQATDVELAPMTPYAIKYAGLTIAQGRLSAELSYRIAPDGQLRARNRLLLQELALEDSGEGHSALAIPVRLAVALLKDNRGRIDVNLPIKGSVDDPEFQLSKLIVRAARNLITNVVKAPFRLLGSLLPGSSEDEHAEGVAFVPGTTRWEAAQVTPLLDSTVAAMAQLPGRSLKVTGGASLAREREAMQREWLERALLNERRQELIRAGAPLDAPVPALSPADRQRLLLRMALSDGVVKNPNTLPPAQLEAQMLAATPVTADQVRELALQRALRLRDALIAKGLKPGRMSLTEPQADLAAAAAAPAPGAAPWVPRAWLTMTE